MMNSLTETLKKYLQVYNIVAIVGNEPKQEQIKILEL